MKILCKLFPKHEFIHTLFSSTFVWTFFNWIYFISTQKQPRLSLTSEFSFCFYYTLHYLWISNASLELSNIAEVLQMIQCEAEKLVFFF